MFSTREEVTDYGLQLTNTHNNICYEWATGLGKSLMSIKVIEKYGGEWKIIIAETNHEMNWIDEFKKHNKEHLLKNVSFHCYQSLHKVVGNYNYIYDECHHLFSDNRMNLSNNIVTYQFNKRNIFLSATLTWKQKENLQAIFSNTYIFKVSLSEAIKMKILPKPSVYLTPIELDNTVKNITYHFSKTKSTVCTEWQAYKFYNDRVNYLKEQYDLTQDKWTRINWLRAGNKRKQFLCDCKTRYAKQLVEKLDNKRLICFAGTIPQAVYLGKELAIHSKIPKKKRLQIIEDFNNQKIHKLFVVDMLKEGMNLVNIEAGIIVQLDNQTRYSVQITGRVLRSIYPEQYVLFVENTQDETYISTMLGGFDSEYVSTINLDEL